MCEQITVLWPSPQPFDRVTDWLLQIERFGSCRLGWGVAWRDRGEVRSYRSIGSFTGDLAGRAILAEVESAEFMVHLRRPTLLSTMQLADAQPFVDAAAPLGPQENATPVGPAIEKSAPPQPARFEA